MRHLHHRTKYIEEISGITAEPNAPLMANVIPDSLSLPLSLSQQVYFL